MISQQPALLKSVVLIPDRWYISKNRLLSSIQDEGSFLLYFYFYGGNYENY